VIRRLLLSALIAAVSLTGCAHTELPSWFDALQRIPLHSVTVRGVRIAYLDSGTGPPVILVHGFGGSMWQWEYQQEALADRFRVITVDLPGSGYSDKPDMAYTPDEIIDLFAGFMDAVGLPRASLVGNSLGAGVAESMAIVHPDRVDRLVLIGGFPDRVRERLTSRFVRSALDTRLPAWLIAFGNLFTGRGLTRLVLEEAVHDRSRLTPAVIERSYRNRQQPGIIAPVLATARNLPLWEQGLAKRLSDIRQPTLILWGEYDKLFPVSVGRDLQARIAGSRFELIPQTGHLAQWERPDLVNPLLRAFLAS
jgi:pimeloyl-ACP methyl ester carboxylesterase